VRGTVHRLTRPKRSRVVHETEPRASSAIEPRTHASLDWTRDGGSPYSRPNVMGLVVGIGLLGVLVLHNRSLLFSHVYEDGDYAANSILIDKARHFELLVGNYSRFGFNHPGPALLYVQAWSELLFRDAVGLFASPFGAQLFGVLVLNATLCGLSAAIVVRRTSRASSAVVLIACVLLYTWLNPGLLASTWMPDIYVWPFLLLLLSAASVATLGLGDAWKLALAVGLLVHGHVSFVFFSIGVTSAVVIALWFQRARLARALLRRPLIHCALILFVFALPIVVNLVVNYPGEFGKYWHYSRSNQAGGHGTRAALAFVGDYWAAGRAGHVVALSLILAAAVLAWTHRERGRGFLVAIVGFVLVASILTTIYAKIGVDDLSLTYIGRFYNAAPILTLFTVGVTAGDLATRQRARYVLAIAVSLALAVLATRSQLDDTYRGASWVPAAVDSFDGAKQTPVELRFDLQFWPQAAGLVEESRRRGGHICVDSLAPIYTTIFTKGLTCSPTRSGGRTGIRIVAPRATRNAIYTGPGFALTKER
jgi:hypothetical protein